MATARELESLLGELQPIYIERIQDTGATLAEAAEALACVELEQRTGERREPSSPRAMAVLAILEAMLEGEFEEERDMCVW